MRAESVCVPGFPGRPNEDFAAVTMCGDLGALVVLDGVSGSGAGCRHGVPWFTARLGTTLLARAATRPDAALAECLADAIAGTADAHRETCDLSRVHTPQSTVVAARWHGESLEYLVLADSVLLLQEPDGEVTPVVHRQIEALAPDVQVRLNALRAEIDAAPPGSRAHDAAVRAFRVANDALRNADGGFFTAAADPSVAARVITGGRRLATVRALAALTDGAGNWVEAFGFGSWADCLRMLEEKGPSALVEQVRSAERADPDRASHHRDKAHDDASVVYVAF